MLLLSILLLLHFYTISIWVRWRRGISDLFFWAWLRMMSLIKVWATSLRWPAFTNWITILEFYHIRRWKIIAQLPTRGVIVLVNFITTALIICTILWAIKNMLLLLLLIEYPSKVTRTNRPKLDANWICTRFDWIIITSIIERINTFGSEWFRYWFLYLAILNPVDRILCLMILLFYHIWEIGG